MPVRRRFVGQFAASPAGQASVPGAYAWALTVVPVAWAHTGWTFAKASAVLALVALFAGISGERRWGIRARVGSLWAFVLGCALTWSVAPAAVARLGADSVRGIGGMVAWSLYAFASAAPVVRRLAEDSSHLQPPARTADASLERADAMYTAGGIALAVVVQVIGWDIRSVERALLVRFIAVATGLGLIGAAAELAVARHAPRAGRSSGARLRGARVWLVALGVLAAVGLPLGLSR